MMHVLTEARAASVRVLVKLTFVKAKSTTPKHLSLRTPPPTNVPIRSLFQSPSSIPRMSPLFLTDNQHRRDGMGQGGQGPCVALGVIKGVCKGNMAPLNRIAQGEVG